MATNSDFSVGLAHKFIANFAKAGGTPADLNALAEDSALLRKILALSPVKKEFPVWRKVTLGRHKSVQAFQEAILAKGCVIGDWAKDLMSTSAFTLAKEEREVILVRATVAELGFPEGATLEEILQAAKERGLELCPAEVGPALREQYVDQPNQEYLAVAMDPIVDSGGNPDLFSVSRRDDGRWLDANDGDMEGGWDGVYAFVFVLPGK